MVDWFRLFLALSVCLTHAKDTYPVWPVNYLAIWAVPGFLSISGFYVLRSYEQSSSWRDFIKKRVLRVMPAFFVSLYIVWLYAGAPGLEGTLRFYFTLGLTTDMGVPNAPLWTLSTEELCYGLLAILFTLGAYKRRWPIWCAFVISCVVATMGAFSGPPAVTMLCNLFAPFFAGSLVYIYRDKITGAFLPGFALIVGAILLPLVHVGYVWPASWVPGLLMGVGILSIRSVRMPKIPDISYGVYVYHMPLFWISYGHAWIFFSSLFYLSISSWYIVERPALTLKTGKGWPKLDPFPSPEEFAA